MEKYFPESFKYFEEFEALAKPLEICDQESLANLKTNTDGTLVREISTKLFEKVFKHEPSTRSADKQLIEQVFKNKLLSQINIAVQNASDPKKCQSASLTPEYFLKKFTDMYGGSPSPSLTGDLTDLKALVDDVGTYRELKLNKKNTTAEVKMVTLVDGSVSLARDNNHGRDPRTVVELFTILIPYLVTLTSVAGIRIGATIPEYLARICYIAINHGETAALKYDRVYRQRLTANANSLSESKGCGYTEAVTRCLLRNEDPELLGEAFATPVSVNTPSKTQVVNTGKGIKRTFTSENCPYGANCELLKKGTCTFGPSRHPQNTFSESFWKRDDNSYNSKKGKGSWFK
jgi:hypothetical protein